MLFVFKKEMAEEYVKMGYLLGIGGVVTFKNAKKLKGSCKKKQYHCRILFWKQIVHILHRNRIVEKKCIFESDLCGTDNCGVERNYYGRSDCCDRRECKRKFLWLR